MIFPAKEARSVDEKIHFVIFDFLIPGRNGQTVATARKIKNSRNENSRQLVRPFAPLLFLVCSHERSFDADFIIRFVVHS
jgi:hypothetical protein